MTFTRTAAALNAYTGGQLTLDRRHAHRARADGRAPGGAGGAGAGRQRQLQRDVRLLRPVHRDARGLMPATRDAPARSPTIRPTAPAAWPRRTPSTIPVTIPAGTTYARFSLFDADVTPAADLDLYVYRGTARWSARSGSGTSAEEVNLREPGGRHLHGRRARLGRRGHDALQAVHLAARRTAAGNMTVERAGQRHDRRDRHHRPDFSGLAAGTKYLGSVAYGGASG